MSQDPSKTIQPGQRVLMRDTKLPEAYSGCPCECHNIAGVMHSWPCCVKPKKEAQQAINRNPQAN